MKILYLERHKLTSAPIQKDPGPERARILIADHQILFREGLRIALEKVRGFSVVACCEDTAKVKRLVTRRKPNILLLNYAAPQFLAAAILRRLEPCAQKVYSIVLADEINQRQMDELIQLGASCIISMDIKISSLAECIHRAVTGFCQRQNCSCPCQRLISNTAKVKQDEPSPIFSLTPREKEVLAYIITGKTNRQVADDFSISQHTVKHHLTNIFNKVGVDNRLELSLFAIHHQILPTSDLPFGISGQTEEQISQSA